MSHSRSSTMEEPNEKEEAFNYDDILKYTGELGKFQLRTCCSLFFAAFFPGMAVMCYSFIGSVPQYGCSLEQCDNTTTYSFTGSYWTNANLSQEDLCYRYNSSLTDPQYVCQPHYIDPGVDDSNLLEKCDRWTYDTSLFTSTIVSDFELTCDDEWKIAAANSVYMFGLLVGSFLMGSLADIFGRRLSFTVNCLVMAAAMTATSFSPDFTTFCIMRFFTGIAAMGHFLILFVWGMEATGKKYRIAIGSMYQTFFSIGCCSIGLLAYFVRDWRTFQLIIGLSMFTPVILYWVVPESTRWLITKKRFNEARKQIEEEMKMNGKTVPEHLLIPPNTDEKNEDRVGVSSISQRVDEENFIEEKPNKSENMIGIFLSPVLCIRILIMGFIWIAVAMSFYGIAFAGSNLSGDFFVNYLLLQAIDIPAHFFFIYLMGKAGRRFTLSAGLLICGLACLATGLVPTDPAAYQIVFSLIGKFFSAGVFDTVFAYTAELFPTHSRSFTSGFCSTLGRIGSILSPIIADMGRTQGIAFPFIVFSIVCIVAGFAAIVLPETNHVPLPSNIKEAKDLSKNSLPCFRCKK